MRRDEPAWWYDERAVVVPRLLAPLSFIYGHIAGRRLARPPAYRSNLPVLCVGNFTVGGTGKTPFAVYLCERLTAMGRHPAFLSRGYGGSNTGPLWVDPERHDATIVGDEPLLLARSAATVVSPDRASGARLIEADPRRFDTIVMDDGFQNRSLAKSLSIVLVSAARGLGNGHTLPGGPLRAPLAMQAPLADAIVLVDGDPPLAGPSLAALKSRLESLCDRPIIEVRIVASMDGLNLAGRPLVAFCGIAGPERFFRTVEGLRPSHLDKVAFRDHQALTEADAARLLSQASLAGAILVTTEKDLARLAGLEGERATLRQASRAIPIRVDLAQADAARLDALLAAGLALR